MRQGAGTQYKWRRKNGKCSDVHLNVQGGEDSHSKSLMAYPKPINEHVSSAMLIETREAASALLIYAN